MHSSYFVLKNKEGKQAEQIVKDYLTDRGYTVQDVSEEQDNYQNDIDFIVQKDGRTSKIEVKLDTRLAKTQNIAFEDVFYLKDKETGQTETREGYYHYSQCDFLIFVSPADKNLYMVHFRKLKENKNIRVIAAEPASCPKLTRGVFQYDFGDEAGYTPLLPMFTHVHKFAP